MSNYIPSTHQTVQQLQSVSVQGVISSVPQTTYTNTVYSTEVVKPSTVYTFSSTNGQQVQLNEKSNVLPTSNIYSSFDPSLNQNSIFVSSNQQSQQLTPQQVYEVKGVPQYQYYGESNVKTNQNEDERIKRSKQSDAGKKKERDSSSSSSDGENKEVKELKFNKSKWGKAYILFAQNYIEQLNNKLNYKEAHISQLMKACSQLQEQLSQGEEINKKNPIIQNQNTNIRDNQEYIYLQEQFQGLRARCEELDIDNQQLAMLVQNKEDEKNDLLAQIVLDKTLIEALTLNPQAVVVQPSYSPELEMWKKKCSELENNLNMLSLTANKQSSYQIEMLNIQLKEKNAELDRLQQQLANSQRNSDLLISLEMENNSLKSQIQTLNVKITSLNVQINQNSQLEMGVNSLEQRLQQYQSHIQNLEEQLKQSSNYKIQLEMTEQKFRQLEGQSGNDIRLRENEIQELRQELKSRFLEIQELKQKISTYESQLSSTQQNLVEIEQLRRSMREYEEKLRSLENQKQNSYQNDQQFEQFNIEIYNLSQQLKIQNQDSNDLRQRCENLQRQLSESELRFSTLQQRFNDSEFSNKVIIEENSKLINRLKEMEFQITQINIYEQQINELREGYFNILAQFVLISSALESQSGNKQLSFNSEVSELRIQISQYQEKIRQLEITQNTSFQQNSELYNLQQEIKILRQDNIDLATRCKNFQTSFESKDMEISRLAAQFNQIENNNKIIIAENSKLILSLQEKDSQIARLQKMESNTQQISILTLEINDWKQKFEQSRQDILVICQETERLKVALADKEREINSLRISQSGNLQKINELTYLEGELSRLRIALQQDQFSNQYIITHKQQQQRQKDEEIYQLKRTDRISAPDNNHQLILQITSKEQELDETKKRFAAYVEKNAELQAEVNMLKTKRLGGGDDSSIGSNADKDQLIHRYRVENKRLQSELQDLQNFVRLNQNELRQLKGKGGCGYGCA